MCIRDSYKEALDVYNEVFKDCCLYKVEAYEGIPELLDFLKEHKILATVLSNKPHQRALDLSLIHIWLCYGSKASFVISSSKEKGTSTLINFPLEYQIVQINEDVMK